MADTLVEFARKVREALGLEKAQKREPRKAEVIEPTTARALEVTLSKPEYGHMYDAQGKDLGASRSLDSGNSTAPYKAGDTMSGPRGKAIHSGGRASQTVQDRPTVTKPVGEDIKYQLAPPTGMQGARNQAAPAPSGQEWDENGNPIHPYVRGPMTPENAWDQITSAPADYMVSKGYVLPPEKQQMVSEAIARAKAGTEKAASAQLQKTMKQVREQPGGDYGAQKGLEFARAGQGAIAKVIDAVEPKTRDISSISREFSNEEDKQRYLEAKSKGGK